MEGRSAESICQEVREASGQKGVIGSVKESRSVEDDGWGDMWYDERAFTRNVKPIKWITSGLRFYRTRVPLHCTH